MTKLEIKMLKTTIGLLNSMVLSGELHSDTSRDLVSGSFEILNNLKPNELRAVNRNEAAKEFCLCGKEIEKPKVLTVCNKCLDEYYAKHKQND